MKKLIRCKVCGYTMAEADLGDKCPACGVSREMFEPYSDSLAEPRRRILDMHLHPIAVHFPTSFATAALVLLIGSFFIGGRAGEYIAHTLKLMILFLPLLVVLAFAAGLLDGKVRFRRIGHSRILKLKMLFGLLFFAFAMGTALVVWLKGFTGARLGLVSGVFAMGGLACAVLLGRLGMRVANSALPGK